MARANEGPAPGSQIVVGGGEGAAAAAEIQKQIIEQLMNDKEIPANLREQRPKQIQKAATQPAKE